MNGITSLKKIALDSNVFIYHFEGNPEFTPFTDKIFGNLIQGKIRAITSIISVIETFSLPGTPQTVNEMREAFLSLPNLDVLDVNQEIAFEAAFIRRTYGFRLPDAVQLATARLNKVQAFVSNDTRLKKFKNLKVVLLDQV